MSIKVGMHQPYMFPYRGYFDLIASVDKFVLYDDAKYMKGGWINRNFFPELFTFRLKKHSDYAKINELRFFDIEEDKKEFARKTGIKSRFVDMLNGRNGVSYNIFRTVKEICEELGIFTPIYLSSEIPHGTFVEGIIDIVKYLGGDTYINAPGGRALYTQDMFGDIELRFIYTKPGPSILCEL